MSFNTTAILDIAAALSQEGHSASAIHLRDAVAEIKRLSAIVNGLKAGVVSASSHGTRVVVRDCACCSDQPTVPPDCPACKGVGGFTTILVHAGPPSSSTPNDEAGIKPASRQSTSNDE
jgi:hypothetical protein